MNVYLVPFRGTRILYYSIYMDTVSPAFGAYEVAPVRTFVPINRSYRLESLGDQKDYSSDSK